MPTKKLWISAWLTKIPYHPVLIFGRAIKEAARPWMNNKNNPGLTEVESGFFIEKNDLKRTLQN